MNNLSVHCLFGIDVSKIRPDPHCLYVFVEDRLELKSLQHSQDIPIYWVETPLQIQCIAQEIGKMAAFLPLTIEDVSHSCLFQNLQEALKMAHIRAELLVNDAADFGRGVIKNALQNVKQPFETLEKLQGIYHNTPAILVGGGPSLQKELLTLEKLRDKALIFAGGSAVEQISFAPDFAVCIDRDKALKTSYTNIPLFFQARMHAKNSKTFRGQRWLIADGHFPFLNTLFQVQPLFDSGWTVGNLMASLACFLGCNPVICVGFDFCYQSKQKYGKGTSMQEKPLIEVENRIQEKVWTQTDFWMAAEWMKSFMQIHPDKTFVSVAEQGLPFFPYQPLDCFLGLEHVEKTPLSFAPQSAQNIETVFKNALVEARLDVENSVLYEDLLKPLWAVWGPIFARHEKNQDLELHRKLFFDSVIEEIS